MKQNTEQKSPKTTFNRRRSAEHSRCDRLEDSQRRHSQYPAVKGESEKQVKYSDQQTAINDRIESPGLF
jgi:hypothetical protein